MLILLIAFVAAGLGAWQLATGGGGPKGKCVSITLAGSTGGESIVKCGNQARSWCATEAEAASPVAPEIRQACRREGFLPG